MRLSKTNLDWYICRGCGRNSSLEHPLGHPTADLDGPAFAAYYCPSCTATLAANVPEGRKCPPERGLFCPSTCRHYPKPGRGCTAPGSPTTQRHSPPPVRV